MIDTDTYAEKRRRAEGVLNKVSRLREGREIDPPEDTFSDVSDHYTRPALGGEKPSVSDLFQQQHQEARQHDFGGGIAAAGAVAGSLGSLHTQESAYEQKRQPEAEFFADADGTTTMMLRMRVARLENRVEKLESQIDDNK